MVEYFILGLLMEQKMSGYDVRRYIQEVQFLNSSSGNIYPALKRLEQEGMIRCSEGVERGKYKKIYKLEEPGREKFLNWIETPSVNPKSPNEHLVKMFFFKYLSKENVLELLPKIIASYQTSQKHVEIMEKYFKGKMDGYQVKTVNFGSEYLRFVVGWYQNFLKELRRIE